MAVKFLDYTGLGYFWSKIKAWCNATFAAITHNQASNTINAMTSYSKPNSGSAITTSDTLNAAIGKLEAKVDAYDDSNYVHKTGHESITGRKVFNITQYYDAESGHHILESRPIIRTLDFARGDAAPSSNQFVSLDMVDNTYDVANPIEGNTILGGLEYAYRTSGARDIKLKVLSAQSSQVGLVLGFDESGISYASAPSTSSQRNGNGDIVTRDWIPNDTRIVHRTGTEEISGYKIYNSLKESDVEDSRQHLKITELNISNPSITRGVDSSGFTAYSQILLTGSTQDSDNDRLSYWFYHHPSDSDPTAYMRIGLGYQYPNTNDVYSSQLTLGYDEINDVAYVTGPATSSLRNSGNDLVTRNWIPNDTRIVHTTGDETINGKKIFTSPIVMNTSDGNWFYNQHLGITKGTLPTTQKGFWSVYSDSVDGSSAHSFVTNWIGLRTDGETVYRISVARNDLNSDWFEWNLVHGASGSKIATLNGEMVLTPPSTTSARLFLQMNDVDTTVTSSSDKIRGAIAFTDKNGTADKYRTAVIQSGINSNDSNFLWLRVYNPTVNSTSYDGICIRYSRGDSYANITMPPQVALRSHTLVKGTNPSSTQYMHLVFSEKNVLDSHTSGRFGGIETAVNTSGQVSSFLIAYKNTANATTNASISVVYPASGDPYTAAPTPVAGDNSTKIATTAWVQTFCGTTKGYVAKSGEEDITGTKWFKDSSCFSYRTAITKGTAPSSNNFQSFAYYDKNKARLGGTEYCARSNGSCDIKIFAFAKDTTKWAAMSVAANAGTTDNRYCFPDGNGEMSLGTSSNRWKQLFAATTTISTSDARLKSNIEKFSDNLLDAWEELEYKSFKFNDAVSVKGVNNARIHSGLIAQQINEILIKYNIDSSKYAFYCWDSWEAKEADYDEDGNQITTPIEAGDAYSLRYEEVLCIEAAYQRRKNKILENRISELEKQVSDMLQILQNLTNSNG